MIQNQTTALLTKNIYFAISTLNCKLHKDKVSVYFTRSKPTIKVWLLNKQMDFNFSLNQTKSVSEWMSQWYLSSLTFYGVDDSFPSFHFFSHFGGTSKEEKELWEPRQEEKKNRGNGQMSPGIIRSRSWGPNSKWQFLLDCKYI